MSDGVIFSYPGRSVPQIFRFSSFVTHCAGFVGSGQPSRVSQFSPIPDGLRPRGKAHSCFFCAEDLFMDFRGRVRAVQRTRPSPILPALPNGGVKRFQRGCLPLSRAGTGVLGPGVIRGRWSILRLGSSAGRLFPWPACGTPGVCSRSSRSGSGSGSRRWCSPCSGPFLSPSGVVPAPRVGVAPCAPGF